MTAASTPTQHAHRTAAPRRCPARAVATIVALAFWGVCFVAALLAIPLVDPPPTWSAADGRPVPADFLYLMYPAASSAPLFDKPDGAPVGTLARAVAVAQEELSGAWISVQTTGAPQWVRASDLRFEPPSDRGGELVRAYLDAYRARNPGADYARASVSQEAIDGAPAVTIFERAADDDHFERYAYRVTEAGARPEKMWHVFGPAWALSGSSPGLAAIGATVITVLAGACVRALVVRRRIRMVAAAQPVM